MIDTSQIFETLLQILFLPFFELLVKFTWGAGDPPAIFWLKRILLFLPALAIILGYWVSVISILTVLIRAKRGPFMTAILVTWWDMGRAIVGFWGGLLKFVLVFTVALFNTSRMIIEGLWYLILDIILIPFRAVRSLGENMLAPGIPWIAIGLTIFWCIFEGIIFTFVMTPLVIDTLSNVTGNQLSESLIKVPLFLFMLFIVLGSYSVLSTFSEAIKTRNIPTIIKIAAIEAVAIFVEVVFLYREFVDALVPWFAQQSGGKFELGLFGTLAIASVTWLGIRALSWFLFASSGTPTIMAIIQGTGLPVRKGEGGGEGTRAMMKLTSGLLTEIKVEMDWIKSKGEEVIGALVLPPLQVIGAAVNFCSLLITTHHLIELPLKSLAELKDARTLIKRMEDNGKKKGE